MRVKSFTAALNFSCPTLITAAPAASFVGPIAGTFIAGSGLILQAASWLSEARADHRDLRRSDPAYYALAVRSLIRAR